MFIQISHFQLSKCCFPSAIAAGREGYGTHALQLITFS